MPGAGGSRPPQLQEKIVQGAGKPHSLSFIFSLFFYYYYFLSVKIGNVFVLQSF